MLTRGLAKLQSAMNFLRQATGVPQIEATGGTRLVSQLPRNRARIPPVRRFPSAGSFRTMGCERAESSGRNLL